MNQLLRHCLLVILLCSASCSASDKMIQGMVVEEGTGAPIPGVIVTGTWSRTGFMTQRFCGHVDSVVTDEHGRFQMKRWSYPFSIEEYFLTGKTLVNLRAYKAELFPAPNVSLRYNKKALEFKLKKFQGSTNERFQYLEQAIVECLSTERPLGLYRAILVEAKAIAETPEQLEKVKWFAQLANDESSIDIKFPVRVPVGVEIAPARPAVMQVPPEKGK